MTCIASVTVVDFKQFSFVIVKTANAAVVTGKIYLAIFASLLLDLLGITSKAFYSFDSISI